MSQSIDFCCDVALNVLQYQELIPLIINNVTLLNFELTNPAVKNNYFLIGIYLIHYKYLISCELENSHSLVMIMLSKMFAKADEYDKL